MFKFLSQLLDLIYKKRCYFCKSTKENSKFCSQCYAKIKFLPYTSLEVINKTKVYSATIYKDIVQKMIRGLKYHKQRELALYQAKIMYQYWCNLEISKQNFVIVPVPISNKRLKERHYNHMSLVANEFAKLTGYEINENLIIRVKDTKPQYKLSKAQRAKNLKGAFEAIKENFAEEKEKNFLIFDDILTTGSTISEITKIFQKNGAKHLTAFTTSCSEYHRHIYET